MKRHIILVTTILLSASTFLSARTGTYAGSSPTKEKGVRKPIPLSVWQVSKRLETFMPSDSCDVIFLETGEEVQAKVIAIREREIEYSYCNDATRQSFTIEKSKVKKVVMASGLTIETAGSVAPPTEAGATYEPKGQENEKLSTAAFIFAVVSLFFYPFATIGIIMGFAALSRHNQEPGRYRNKWMAIYSIVSGIVITFFLVLFLLVILGLIF